MPDNRTPMISKDPATGRVEVLATKSLLPCIVIKVDGAWRKGSFSADDFKDNFVRVKDTKEIDMLLQEARTVILKGNNSRGRK